MYTFTYYHLNDCTSTMDLKYKPWSAVYTDSQTDGKGTKNRTWVSHSDNLMCTFFLPFGINFNPTLLCLQIGVHVANAIGEPVKLRWQNDIVINGKKCGGILITKKSEIVKIGIGINIETSPELADQETTCLKDHKINIDKLTLLKKIGENISCAFLNHKSTIKSWEKLADWGPGKYGIPIKINSKGYLLVRQPNSFITKVIKNVI